MLKKLGKVANVILSLIFGYIAVLFLASGDYIAALIIIGIIARSLYSVFRSVPPPPEHTALQFSEITQYANEHGVKAVFAGTIRELEQSVAWGDTVASAKEITTTLTNVSSSQNTSFGGNPLVSVALNMGINAGVQKLVESSSKLLVVRFVDDTYKISVLGNGVTKEVRSFIDKAKGQNLAVEDNVPQTNVIGGVGILLAILALIVILIIIANW